MKNLAIGGTFRDMTQGLTMIDIGAAVGGLAASSMIPGMVVKDTATNAKKALKLAVSFGCAVAVGAIAKSSISESAGRAAVLGGMTGFGVQLLSTLTGIQVGGIGSRGMIASKSGGSVRRYPAEATETPFGTARLS